MDLKERRRDRVQTDGQGLTKNTNCLLNGHDIKYDKRGYGAWLELENEELKRSRKRLLSALSRHRKLYDNAPAAFFLI